MGWAARGLWSVFRFVSAFGLLSRRVRDSTDWNHDTRKYAQSHFLALTRFPFIFSIVVTKEVLGYTKALSIKLQGRYVDVVRAYNDVIFVQEVLESARKDVESFHTRIYTVALAIARKVNVNESTPRTTDRKVNVNESTPRTTYRQGHRCNAPLSSPPEYFKRQLTIPALDHLISEISEWFSFSKTLSQILKLLPSSVAESKEELTQHKKLNFLHFAS